MLRFVENLLTAHQCESIIAAAAPHLHANFRPTFAEGRSGAQVECQILAGLLCDLTDIQPAQVQLPEVVRYETGCRYPWHRDSIPGKRRDYTLLLGLNDDYEGGETEFYRPPRLIRLPLGGGVLFDDTPANRHRVLTVTRGEKWSCVIWGEACFGPR